MSNEPLNHEPSPAHDHLDQRLIRALETAPICQIPPDFAVRLAASLPPRSSAPISATIPATHYGRSAILVGIVVVLAAMLTLAAHSANHSTFDVVLEWTLFAQFLALTVWFSTWHRGVN
jgi:hypothetical protein